jgi:hypothetical protein
VKKNNNTIEKIMLLFYQLNTVGLPIEEEAQIFQLSSSFNN